MRTLAALLLIADCPAQAEKREEDEKEHLQQIGGQRARMVEWYGNSDAEQEREKENLYRFHRKEKLALDPEEPLCMTFRGVAARCRGEQYEDDMRRGNEAAAPLLADIGA